MPTAPHDSASTTPKLIPLARIDLSHSIQARVQLDERTVAEYAEQMRKGAKFPPIVLFAGGELLILSDGWHRVEAALKCGWIEILAIVLPGDPKQALRYAIGANQDHGLRPKMADKRRFVLLALQELPTMSDRAIAALCHVSQPFVGKIRRCENVISPEVRIGRDNIARKVGRKAHEDSSDRLNNTAYVALTKLDPFGRRLQLKFLMGDALPLAIYDDQDKAEFKRRFCDYVDAAAEFVPRQNDREGQA